MKFNNFAVFVALFSFSGVFAGSDSFQTTESLKLSGPLESSELKSSDPTVIINTIKGYCAENDGKFILIEANIDRLLDSVSQLKNNCPIFKVEVLKKLRAGLTETEMRKLLTNDDSDFKFWTELLDLTTGSESENETETELKKDTESSNMHYYFAVGAMAVIATALTYWYVLT